MTQRPRMLARASGVLFYCGVYKSNSVPMSPTCGLFQNHEVEHYSEQIGV